MKAIFLDIDGVICSIRSAVAYGGYPWKIDEDSISLFDEVAVALIRQVCEKTEAVVILSSVWRKYHDIKLIGVTLELPIIDKTPVIVGKRGNEIKAFLEQNPQIKKYAIVDDDSNMLDEQMPYFVKVDSKEGLSYGNYEQLLTILTPSK